MGVVERGGGRPSASPSRYVALRLDERKGRVRCRCWRSGGRRRGRWWRSCGSEGGVDGGREEVGGL